MGLTVNLSNRLLLSVCVIFLTTLAAANATPTTCSSIGETPLLDLNRRSRIYTASRTETLLNDQVLSEGWYSTGAYNMPRSPPMPGMCGSYYPVWMNGTIPKPADGVQPMFACEADIYSNCTKVIHNKVINCGGNKLKYYLKPTGNRFAYCFDPPSLSSVAVINPKPAYRPKTAVVKVDLTWKSGRVYIPSLRFTCLFDPKPSDKTLMYNVYWFVDGKTLPLENSITGSQAANAFITEDKLKSLGVDIKCGIRVKNGDFGLLNEMVLSDSVFAGIKVHTPILTVKRGLTAKIIIEPTVPFGCPSGPLRALSCKGNEGLQISMYEPAASAGCDDGTKLAVAKALTCGVYIEGISHDESLRNKSVNWRRNYTFEVTTASDKEMDMFKTKFIVNLKTGDAPDNTSRIWSGYVLSSVTVNVHDKDKAWKGKICSAHGDPHMITSDGKSYDCMDHAEYIVYKHKKYPMQVQMKTKPCHHWSKYAECACAVSVRAGGDIFIIDLCNGKNFVDFVSCKDHILDVVAETENKYKITLPIGTVIRLTKPGNQFLKGTVNIDINHAIKDVNAIQGLCGNYNGDPNDDFMERNTGRVLTKAAFISSWKVKSFESLLNNITHNPPRWSKNESLCVCHGKQTICSAKESVTCHSYPNPKEFQCRLRKGSGNVRRRRMALHSDDSVSDDRISKKSEQQESKPLEVRQVRKVDEHQTATVPARIEVAVVIKSKTRPVIVQPKRRAAPPVPMSMSKANKTCTDIFIKHPNYGLSDKIHATTSLSHSLNECILDLNLTGEVAWADAHVDGWVDNSMSLIERNNTFRAAEPVVALTFAENACPASCSGHGNCTNGTCECDTNFIAADCSIDSRIPPRVDEVYNNGLCDWKDDDCCDGFSVYGEPFVQTTMCTIEEVTIYTDGSRSSLKRHQGKAHFRSSYEVVCPNNCTRGLTTHGQNGKHQFITTYNISVSNDGTSFGVKFPMLVYDSQCQLLINDSTRISFGLKDGFCYIDGECIKDGGQKPKEKCFLCDAKDPYTWTRNTACDTVVAPSGAGGTALDGTHKKRRHNGSASLARLNAAIVFSASLLCWLL